MKRTISLALLAGLSCVLVLLLPVGGSIIEARPMPAKSNFQRLDLSGISKESPQTNLNLLFIHHSSGGQWLAPVGPDNGTNCIYTSHPNGGNLRALLEKSGYQTHEASYGSRIGQNTDIFDWLPKFQAQMDEVLRCDVQDTLLAGNHRNQVVMFKPCFPNNAFRSKGLPPGNPSGPELTVWNAKAAYAALLGEFRKQPDVLFVCITAPPLLSRQQPVPLWRHLARKLKGSNWDLAQSGTLARDFNNWLCDSNGWLKDYPFKNVVVFDYYDVLTDNGASDFLTYTTGDGYDSHPSRTGNEKAAQAFVPFLNQAVRRASLAH